MAVRVDVLAEQRHFAIARGGQGACLGHDVVERPAALGPARERHDAVGARLVAAVDDRQPGRDRARIGERGPPPPPRRASPAGHRPSPRTKHQRAAVRPRVGRPAVPAPWARPGRVEGSARALRRAAGRGRPRGSASSSPAVLFARTEQPVITTRSAGLAARSRARCPIRPMTFCSAASRMAHVLMTIRSADSRPAASAQPAASKRAGHLLRVGAVHLAAQRPDVEASAGPRRRSRTPPATASGRTGRAAHARRRQVEHRQGCASSCRWRPDRAICSSSRSATSRGT